MTDVTLQRSALRRLGYYYDKHELPDEALLPGQPAEVRAGILIGLQRQGYACPVIDLGSNDTDWLITEKGLTAYHHLCRTGEMP